MKSKLTQPKANAAGVRKLPSAPARYQPLPIPRVLQTKQTNQPPEAPRRGRSSPTAPPPYQPQPTPRVLQRKTAIGPSPLTPKPGLPQSPAQPVKSAVSRQIMQMKDPSASRGGLVIQRASRGRGAGAGSDEAAHNWDKVINEYTEGVADEIDTAFSKAGYGAPDKRRKAILKAMRETRWHKSKIAHSLGDKGSAMRAGTLEKINNCKTDLLRWAKANPAAVPSAPVFGSSARKEKKESDDFDRTSFSILQFARWAKDNDKDSLEALRKLAKGGNELAQQKLDEVLAFLQPAAAAVAVALVAPPVPPLLPPQGQGDAAQDVDGGGS